MKKTILLVMLIGLMLVCLPALAEEWGENQTITESATINLGVTIKQSITLTVQNGATLTVNGGIANNGHMLTVEGSGHLIVTGAFGRSVGADGGAGISGDLTVNGASVTVTGGSGNMGQSGGSQTVGGDGGAGGYGVEGNLTVHAGSVTVRGGNGGAGGWGYSKRGTGGAGRAGVAGNVTITNGSLTVAGGSGGSGGTSILGSDGSKGSSAIGIGGTLNVSDGIATVSGGADDVRAVSGTITLGEGRSAEDSDDGTTWNTLSGSESNKRYVKCLGGNHGIFIQEEIEHGSVTALYHEVNVTSAPENSIVTLAAYPDPDDGYALYSLTVNEEEVIDHVTEGNTYRFTMPDEDVHVNASFIKTETDCIAVTKPSDFGALSDGNYALNSGNYRLYRDVKTDACLSVASGVIAVVDLNGHTLERELILQNSDAGIIYINQGDLTLNDSKTGGMITGEAPSGIYLDNGLFTMNGGSICGISGNGVYLKKGSFTMNGGSICGNSASIGGGVFVGGTFNVSGSAKITGNKNYDDEDENVYVWNQTGKIITVSGALSEDASIGVTLDNPAEFTSGLSGMGTSANFFSDDMSYRVRLNADGEAELYAPEFFAVSTESYEHGSVTASMNGLQAAQAAENDSVILTVAPEEDYILAENGLTVSYADGTVAVTPVEGQDNQYAFTMPVGTVTVSATFVIDPAHFSVNETGNEYTIRSEIGWNYFCDCLLDNDNWNGFSGKTVKLGNSISVSRCAGSGSDEHHAMNENPFCGTFDGGGNTLTFNYGSSGAPSGEDYIAPFRFIKGATIKKLNVSGTIYTAHTHSAGIIGLCYGTTNVTDCHSSIHIVSSVNGDGTHAGLIACTWTDAPTDITNCVFDGSIVSAQGVVTHSCAGFIGWQNARVNVTNCLMAADMSTIGDASETAYPSCTFVRRNGGVNVTDSYYTVPFGILQGEAISVLTLPEGVTASVAEGGTVSYDNKTWYIEGETVTLTVTLLAGFALAENGLAVSYTDAQGETQNIELTQEEGDNADKWTFTMPSANVTVTAAYIHVDPVDYVERSWNGTAVVSTNQTRSGVAPVPSDGQMTSGWYYLNSDVTVDGLVSLTGDTHLILGDGYTLDAAGLYIPQGSTLTIYGQSDGEDAGKIDSHPSSGAGIGGYSGHQNGNIAIHGGTVMATGGSGGAGIGGGDGDNGGTITIYGGSVTTTGGSDGAGIGGGDGGNGGTITIYGGTVTANGPTDSDCSENGAGIGGGKYGDGGTITIFGGTITTYSRDGAGIGGGDDGAGGTITIHGGTITSDKVNQGQGARIGGGNDAAPGTIIIDGGTVTTVGGKGAGIGGGKGNRTGGSVTITGGVINATGSYGIGSGEDGSDVAITLSLSGENDSITASGYYGAVTVAEGCSLKDNEENLYYGILNDDQKTAIAGETLVKGPAGYAVNVADMQNGTVTADPGFAQANTVIALTVTPDERCTLKSLTVTQGETPVDVDENNSFTMPAGNVTVTAIFAKRYMYLDSNGAVKYAIATPLTGETESMTGWYAVEGNVTIEDRLWVLDDAHLILCDGCTLNAENGIDVSAGNSLAIYAQSAGGNMGVLNATAGVDDYGSAGIGGGYEPSGGTITINGGKITANGGRDGAGIGGGYGGGCGSITINGGDITARGGSSSGDHGSACIGGGSGGTGGSITINGGTITALGNSWRVWGIGNGYQGSDVTVTINGGNILAEGGYYSEHGIDGTITLSYTKATDSITASAYRGTVTVSEGKTFKDESGNIYTSETSSDTFGALANATLTPAYVYSVNVDECLNGTVTAQEMAAGGETVTLTVTPAEGYALLPNSLSVFWTDENNAEHDVEATQGTGDETDKWSFEMPDHYVTVTVAFERVFGPAAFTLPEGLTTIEENAFEGSTSMTVVDASNCTNIGAYAFKGCTGLTQIRLDKDCDIDNTAFSDCGTVYVFAQANGKTEMFCDTHEGIEFVAID